MRKKTINKEQIQGYLYDSKLEVKKVQNESSPNYGQEYIGGSIDIATTEDGMNIVTIKYTYVTPKTKKGEKNRTYDTLLQIKDGKTWVKDGKENALKVKADNVSLALNEFFSDRTGEKELVSAKENNGGFITIVSDLEPNEEKRTKFECDMYITGYRDIEEDPERNIQAHGEISGWVFNFRNDPLPVTFKIRNPRGIDYFSSLDVNEHNPVFTFVRGVLNNSTRVYKTEIRSAWGETEVDEKVFTSKEWVVTASAPEVYPLGDEENGITPEDVQNLKVLREKTVAEIKARQEAYEASKEQNNSFGEVATSPVKANVTAKYNF